MAGFNQEKDRLRDTWHCPICRTWVELPLRNGRQFKVKHKFLCEQKSKVSVA